jgi:fluoride ion exporter CrcB/FEX
MQDPHDVDAAWSAFAAAGGLARYLHEWLRSDGAKKFQWSNLAASVVVSAFTGTSAYTLANLSGKPEWAGLAAGVGGYMGGATMDYIYFLFSKSLPKKGNDK